MAEEKEQNRVISYTALPGGGHVAESSSYVDPEFTRLTKSLEDGWLVLDVITSPNHSSVGGTTVTVILVRNSTAYRAYIGNRK